MTNPDDTIYALATPPGRSGVAVVRVSGSGARESLACLIEGHLPAPRLASLRRLIHPRTGHTVDQALVILFAGPASYTGEDCVEYHLHGGRAVIDGLLDVLAAQPGHRLAEPGEFTRRAFENGKMDLTAAEAVADLIDAETALQKEQALAQMGGVLFRIYQDWAERLTKALAHIEAEIDFPDEDLPEDIGTAMRPELEALLRDIAAHLDDRRRGERLRDGIHVAVLGAPNAGKSSLVNALARRDAAIVSALPGTTRDIIEVHLDLGGYPVILADTAGLRPDALGSESHDAIEGEGIRRALERSRQADLRLLVFDSTLPVLDSRTQALSDSDSIAVFNKADLHTARAPDRLYVSAMTGEGLSALSRALTDQIGRIMGNRTAPSPTRQRHRAALEEAASCLRRALEPDLPPELLAENARLALRALGRITGRVDVEDLLDRVFRDFCIGK